MPQKEANQCTGTNLYKTKTHRRFDFIKHISDPKQKPPPKVVKKQTNKEFVRNINLESIIRCFSRIFPTRGNSLCSHEGKKNPRVCVSSSTARCTNSLWAQRHLGQWSQTCLSPRTGQRSTQFYCSPVTLALLWSLS